MPDLATATYPHQRRSAPILNRAPSIISLYLGGYKAKNPAPLAKDRDFEMVGMAGFEPTTFVEIPRISRCK